MIPINKCRCRANSPNSINLISIKYFVLISCLISKTAGDLQEMQLVKYLMRNYNPSVRPAHHFSEPLLVSFRLSLHHILDVDEKNQILTTSCWLTQTWKDHHLSWNSTAFGGNKIIRLPYSKVWRPDIILYNNADSQYSSSVINTNVLVTHEGEVTWMSHGIFRSSCDINVEYFPFDIQSCTLKWASWTYDGYQVELEEPETEGDVSNYHANGEFDLVSFLGKRNVQIYSCCPEPYPDVTYTIAMKRRPMFYVFNLIIPCLLINGIALLVFFVPCDSGEKVTLGISALLSMTVFLMTIRESLPPTEKTPLIAMYYGVSICIVTFASGMAVVTLNIHHRGFRGLPVPKLLRYLTFGILAKILFLSDEHIIAEATSGILPTTTPNLIPADDGISSGNKIKGGKYYGRRQLDAQSASRKCDYTDFIQSSPRFQPRRDGNIFGNNENQTATSILDSRIAKLALRICETLEKLEERTSERGRQESIQLEWKKVGIVVDRFLFWIFATVTAISTSMILLSSPY